jgi:hypothetical protein
MGAVVAARFPGPGRRQQIVRRQAFRRSSLHPGTRATLANRPTWSCFIVFAVFIVFFSASAIPLHAREHDRKLRSEDYGSGFSTEISSPVKEVLQAVEAVVNDGLIEGSKEYNKDKYIEDAHPATSSRLFPDWKEPGTVYYKVRTGVLAPLNFRDSKDEGTLAVRYIVQSKDASKTILRIDAVFVEDFHRTVHPSDGSVEEAESEDIQDRIDTVQAENKRNQERQKQLQEKLATQTLERERQAEQASALAAAQTSAQTLDQQLNQLRHEAERVVKPPGAQLKSAPFRSASSVKTLEPGAEVVIVVVTAYWYGVETTDGQHGWINRRLLEPLP